MFYKSYQKHTITTVVGSDWIYIYGNNIDNLHANET